MSLDAKTLSLIKAVLRSKTSDFSALVRLAELDPRTDFIGADLSCVDFGRAKLSGFNFYGSDLHQAKFTAASLEGAIFEGADLEGAAFPTTVSAAENKNPVPPLLPFQLAAYDAAIQCLKERKPALIVTPLGTGRSRVALEIIKWEHNRRGATCVHVIAPTQNEVEQFIHMLQSLAPELRCARKYWEVENSFLSYDVLVENQGAISKRRRPEQPESKTFSLSICLDAARFTVDPDATDFDEARRMIGFASSFSYNLDRDRMPKAPLRLMKLIGSPAYSYEIHQAVRDRVLHEASVIDRSRVKEIGSYRFLDGFEEQLPEDYSAVDDASGDLLDQLAEARWIGDTCIVVTNSTDDVRAYAHLIDDAWNKLPPFKKRQMGLPERLTTALLTAGTGAEHVADIASRPGIILTTRHRLAKVDLRSVKYVACFANMLSAEVMEHILFRRPTSEAHPVFRVYDYRGDLVSAITRTL